MTFHRLCYIFLGVGLSLVFGVAQSKEGSLQSSGTAKPALTVATTLPVQVEWPRRIVAYGTIAPWQETLISSEISNYRISEVLVEVGDTVRKGQLLVTLASDTVAAELAQARAALAEAEATLAEAKANGDRARHLQHSAALSNQQSTQYLTAEQTASARVAAARARVQSEELRLSQTRILAPDEGVISARPATVGALAQSGQELLRLIRGGRLEWRAEVTAAEMSHLSVGGKVTIQPASGPPLAGQIRRIAPTVDPRTLNGLVYVDLPIGHTGARAGTFARGELALGHSQALTLPQSAVLLRDGFAYVFRLERGNTVAQTKVQVDRRAGDRVEITSGLDPTVAVVISGAGFLTDGDLVRVVDGSTP